MSARRSAPWLFLLVLVGCKGPEPEPKDEETPLAKATRALEGGDAVGARKALEQILSEDDDDLRARYLLARALATLGELRGAKANLLPILEERPADALALSLLAAVHETLGEHHQALACYARLQSQVPESLDPLRGVVRCQLLLGQPEQALATIAAGRGRPTEDPWLDYLEWQAMRRLGRLEGADMAARRFLEASVQAPELKGAASDVKFWVAERAHLLDSASRQLMIDYVRAACRLRLPDSVGPEEALLADVPARMVAFDDRPVFVTVSVPGTKTRFRGRGRGKSLLAALKGAVAAVQERPGYTALQVREAAVLIDVGHALEPVKLRQGTHGLEADPPLVRGRHGLILRADGREIQSLPSDGLVRGLPDLRAMLEDAALEGGLAADAWQSSTQSVFRFRTESFLSPTPGAAPISLIDGEPQPLPEPYPRELTAALVSGARFATGLLLVDGGCAASYQASRDETARVGPTQPGQPEAAPLEASPADEARLALTLVQLHRRSEDPVLLAAARHVTDRVVARMLAGGATDTEAAAWLLLALDEVAATKGGEQHAPTARRDELAAALLRVEDPAARGPARLALLGHARATGEARWREAARALPLPPGDDPLAAAEELLALEQLNASERAALLAWAGERLASREKERELPVERRARTLTALAGAARVARDARDPLFPDLRQAVQSLAGELLALQLGERHRALFPAPNRALGGFRARMDDSTLSPRPTAECLLGLAAALDVLQ